MARVVGHIVEAEHIQTFTGRLTYHLMLEVSVEEFEHYRRYIEENGRCAKLREGEYLWYSSL